MAKDNELNENQEHQDEQQPKHESKFKAPWNKKFGEDENLKTRQYFMPDLVQQNQVEAWDPLRQLQV